MRSLCPRGLVEQLVGVGEVDVLIVVVGGEMRVVQDLARCCGQADLGQLGQVVQLVWTLRAIVRHPQVRLCYAYGPLRTLIWKKKKPHE